MATFIQGTGQVYAPTPSSPIPVNVVSGDNTITICGKNLFHYRTPDYSGGNAWEGYGNVSYALVDNGVVLEARYRAFAYELNNLIVGETYTFSFDAISNISVSVGVGLNVYNNSTANPKPTITINPTTTKNRYSFTFTAQSTNRIAINSGNNANLTNLTITDMQIEKGSTPTTYEPYTSQSYNVNLGTIELNKIGDYQDYIYKDNDKWYLHKEIGKVVLNGSESWSYEGGRFLVNFLITALDTSGRQQALSNYFNYVASGSASYGIFIYKASDTNYQIYIYDSDYTTANDFKTWLTTHNTNVYYILGTPTETEITDTTLLSQLEAIKSATSYEGQTNISSGFMIIGASALGELNNASYELD